MTCGAEECNVVVARLRGQERVPEIAGSQARILFMDVEMDRYIGRQLLCLLDGQMVRMQMSNTDEVRWTLRQEVSDP